MNKSHTAKFLKLQESSTTTPIYRTRNEHNIWQNTFLVSVVKVSQCDGHSSKLLNQQLSLTPAKWLLSTGLLIAMLVLRRLKASIICFAGLFCFEISQPFA